MMELGIQMKTPASFAKILMEMIPGPGHGEGGLGAGNIQVGILTATDEWVENDTDPVRRKR